MVQMHKKTAKGAFDRRTWVNVIYLWFARSLSSAKFDDFAKTVKSFSRLSLTRERVYNEGEQKLFLTFF
jgi:hypothetical protein